MSVSQVAPNLYIGDIDDVREDDTSQFDVVVGVCQDDCSDNVSCDYEHFPLADGPVASGEIRGEYSYELFSDAVDAILSARIRRKCVLAHCHAGKSRSVAAATAALAVLDGLSFDDAYEQVKSARSIANPVQELRDDARRYIDEHR